eukprot:Pgem_evm1s5618
MDNKTICSVFAFNLNDNGHISLKKGFAQYVKICESLDLSNYGLRSLETNLFDDFVALTFLDLTKNNISSLPIG